jgi:hypothetical protein
MEEAGAHARLGDSAAARLPIGFEIPAYGDGKHARFLARDLVDLPAPRAA